MGKRRIYDKEFKLKAILLSYENGNVTQTAKDLQISLNYLSLWRNEFKKNGEASFPGFGNLTLSPRDKKVYNLEKKIKETDIKFEIIKNASKHIFLGKLSVFQFMIENEKKYSIKLMSKTLGVNRGTYRIWKRGLPTETQKLRIALKEEISSIFFNSKETYGCWRIAVELQKAGYFVSHTTVLKCMRELGLFVSVKKNN